MIGTSVCKDIYIYTKNVRSNTSPLGPVGTYIHISIQKCTHVHLSKCMSMSCAYLGMHIYVLCVHYIFECTSECVCVCTAVWKCICRIQCEWLHVYNSVQLSRYMMVCKYVRIQVCVEVCTYGNHVPYFCQCFDFGLHVYLYDRLCMSNVCCCHCTRTLATVWMAVPNFFQPLWMFCPASGSNSVIQPGSQWSWQQTVRVVRVRPNTLAISL